MNNKAISVVARFLILLGGLIAFNAQSQVQDFSGKYDEGLAPLRPCYSKWIHQLDNGSIAEWDLVRAVINKCSQETQILIQENLHNGMLGTPGNRSEANSTIEHWALGVVRWMRSAKK